MTLPSSRRKRPDLRRAYWLLLVLGIACLAYVGYSLLDEKLFQAYESWRFDKAVEKSKQTAATAQPETIAAAPIAGAEVRNVVAVARGSTLGRIEVNTLGLNVIIVEGIDGKTLRRAVGHIPGTALPGQLGNVGIAGHRDTFFRSLRDIHKDAEITLTTIDRTYRYSVDFTRVVEPEAIEVLADTGDEVLTLVTCYPFDYIGPAPKRFIVRAHRIPG